jgi:hypothetical protein
MLDPEQLNQTTELTNAAIAQVPVPLNFLKADFLPIS